MKKNITDYLGNIYWGDWDGESFGDFKKHINELEIPDEATLDHDYESTGCSFQLRREETDEEYEKRLVIENAKRVEYRKAAEEREKEEYLRLKAKFESNEKR